VEIPVVLSNLIWGKEVEMNYLHLVQSPKLAVRKCGGIN